jgi:hypothetical protein
MTSCAHADPDNDSSHPAKFRLWRPCGFGGFAERAGTRESITETAFVMSFLDALEEREAAIRAFVYPPYFFAAE